MFCKVDFYNVIQSGTSTIIAEAVKFTAGKSCNETVAKQGHPNLGESCKLHLPFPIFLNLSCTKLSPTTFCRINLKRIRNTLYRAHQSTGPRHKFKLSFGFSSTHKL
jgi:hypothetical protein